MKLVVKVVKHIAWRGHKMKPTAWRMIIIKESTASSKLKTMARRQSSIVKSTAWRKEMVEEYPARRGVTMVSGLD